MPTQAEMRARLRRPAQSQPWEFLSRWRTLPREGRWQVLSEAGLLAPEPHTFDDQGRAQKRADVLNREEQYSMIGRKPPT